MVNYNIDLDGLLFNSIIRIKFMVIIYSDIMDDIIYSNILL